jgi:hypothetical protein
MKSGKGVIDGTEYTLKLTPDLLLYDSSDGKHGSIFLRSIRVVGVNKMDELVIDYENNQYELARINIQPTGDVTLFQKSRVFDDDHSYVVSGEGVPTRLFGGPVTWLLEWYATLGCGRAGVVGFDYWDDQAETLFHEKGKMIKPLWVSPISFLYDQVTITDYEPLCEKIFAIWKSAVEKASSEASVGNPIDPREVIDFGEPPDFYRNLCLESILEKKHGLAPDAWIELNLVNISKFSSLVRRDWARQEYIRFMLGWVKFRSGGAYSSYYGMWPEEYEQFFIKTGVIDKPFVSEEEKKRARKYSECVVMDRYMAKVQDNETLATFKDWFAK